MSTAAEIPLRSRRVQLRTGGPAVVDITSPTVGIGPDRVGSRRVRQAGRAARIERVVLELQRRARQRERKPLGPPLRRVAGDLGRRWTR